MRSCYSFCQLLSTVVSTTTKHDHDEYILLHELVDYCFWGSHCILKLDLCLGQKKSHYMYEDKIVALSYTCVRFLHSIKSLFSISTPTSKAVRDFQFKNSNYFRIHFLKYTVSLNQPDCWIENWKPAGGSFFFWMMDW